MNEDQIKATFDDCFITLLEAHNAFMDRAMEASPDKMAVFCYCCDETEKKGGMVAKPSDHPAIKAKIELTRALRKLLPAHDNVVRLAQEYAKLKADYSRTRN